MWFLDEPTADCQWHSPSPLIIVIIASWRVRWLIGKSNSLEVDPITHGDLRRPWDKPQPLFWWDRELNSESLISQSAREEFLAVAKAVVSPNVNYDLEKVKGGKTHVRTLCYWNLHWIRWVSWSNGFCTRESKPMWCFLSCFRFTFSCYLSDIALFYFIQKSDKCAKQMWLRKMLAPR